MLLFPLPEDGLSGIGPEDLCAITKTMLGRGWGRRKKRRNQSENVYSIKVLPEGFS